MTQYTFSLDIPSSQDIDKMIKSLVLPKITQAVHAIATQAKLDWQDAVYQARLWTGEKVPYMASIQMQMTGPFSAVVSTDYKYADDIETGRPAKDLKQMLNTSPKVRRTKDGRRFLVIPMRHNTPGNDALAPSMPKDVYQMAKTLTASTVTGSGKRPSGEVTMFSPKTGMHAAGKQTSFLSHAASGTHYLVNKSSYTWGERLKPAMLHGQSKSDRKKYAGMVRFGTSTGGSTYMTFRIMMEGSTGWVIPAQPGKYLAKKVADKLTPLAGNILFESINRSIF